jgi:F-type H+-transporting ATPase subunit delta
VRTSIVARNYAETLIALANKHGGTAAVEEYGRAIDEVAQLLEREPRIRQFLETPRVDMEAKKSVIRSAFGGRVPELFLRFLLVVVDKRRGTALRQIAAAYRDLVDEMLGRVRTEVSLAHAPDPALQASIQASLEGRLGKAVVPTFRVDPTMLGGVVVRVEDVVIDGSVRHQLSEMRRMMLNAPLPEPVPQA